MQHKKGVSGGGNVSAGQGIGNVPYHENFGVEPIAGGLKLIGNNRSNCNNFLENYVVQGNFISKEEYRRYSEELLVKEFRDGLVFIRFTVDDIERSWACIRDVPAWNPNHIRPYLNHHTERSFGPVAVAPPFVLISGSGGEVGAKYNRMNDTCEIIDVNDRDHEIHVKFTNFEKKMDRIIKARIIPSPQNNQNGSIVEFEFEQTNEEGKSSSFCILSPCLLPMTIFFFILAAIGMPIISLVLICGNKLKPHGKFLEHAESMKLRGVFHSYTGGRQLETGIAFASALGK